MAGGDFGTMCHLRIDIRFSYAIHKKYYFKVCIFNKKKIWVYVASLICILMASGDFGTICTFEQWKKSL